MKNIPISKNIKLAPKDSILRAMQKLNDGDYKFQLVIDSNKKLLGTISDGDIRRSILDGVNLNDSVTSCMNKNPSISYDYKINEHKNILEGIPSTVKFLPILDKKDKVLHVIINEEEVINKTALIMAGGYGKRLGYRTKNMPKPLLKIGNDPILELLLRKLEDVNYNNIYLSTFYLHEKIEKFVKKRKSKAKIHILIENKPLGTAGSINLIPKNEYDVLTIINADVITDVDFKALNNFHLEKHNDITLTVAKYEYIVPFGVVDINDSHDFKAVSEKPVLTHLVLSGIYCLNKNICNLITNKKIDMTTVVSQAKKLGKKIGIFPIYEYWKDVGNPDDLNMVVKRSNKNNE